MAAAFAAAVQSLLLLLLLLLQVELPEGLCEYTLRATGEQLQQSLAAVPLVLQVFTTSSSKSNATAATTAAAAADCCLGEARADLSPLLLQPLQSDSAAPHRYQKLGLLLPLQQPQQQQQQHQRQPPAVMGEGNGSPVLEGLGFRV